ncbi:MAG TPA: hypothetical protein VHW23_16755 [Kofleriaceae bacterium]|nr:hypothetical protein [Kofleriaceae bacterium]
MMLFAVAMGAAATARAQSARPEQPGPGQPVAIAVNILPVAWDTMVAATAWVGLDAHQAIRANVARYRSSIAAAFLSGFDDEGPEEGDVPPDFGATTDLSVGWSYYPRRVLDGASIEAELLTRFDRRRSYIDGQNMAAEEHHTNRYGGRLLVGWTWRLSDWWFLATAVGGSAGYERGHEKTYAGPGPGPGLSNHAQVSQATTSFEGYLRIGVALGQ